MLKVKNIIILVVVSFLVFTVYACVLGQVPTVPAAVSGEGTPSLSAKPAWEEDWERTLREARKEGKVVVYRGFGVEWRTIITGPLSQKYGITIEIDELTARSGEITERVMRERNSNVNQADVVMVASGSFVNTLGPAGVGQSLENVLVLPEVVDPKVWWQGKLPWVDPDTKTNFQFFDYPLAPMGINTDLVKPGELKSWRDLLNPKFRGKILINDPTVTGSGQKIMTALAYGIMDWDFINDLIKQEPLLQRNIRLMTEWVARARFPVIIGTDDTILEFMRAGAQVESIVPQEGTYLTGGWGFVLMPKGAPHPNAVKVFINFLLSKEGQTLMSKAIGNQSSRIDVPTDHLEPSSVRQPGVKYISTTSKDFMEKEGKIRDQVRELFGRLSR